MMEQRMHLSKSLLFVCTMYVLWYPFNSYGKLESEGRNYIFNETQTNNSNGIINGKKAFISK